MELMLTTLIDPEFERNVRLLRIGIWVAIHGVALYFSLSAIRSTTFPALPAMSIAASLTGLALAVLGYPPLWIAPAVSISAGSLVLYAVRTRTPHEDSDDDTAAGGAL